MDITINQRLKHYLESVKINEPELYKKIYVSASLWSDYKTGTKSFGIDKIILFLKQRIDLNSRWLLTGEGPMLNEGSPSESNKQEQSSQFGNSYEKLIETQDICIKLLKEKIESLEAKIKELESLKIKKPTEKIGYKSDEPGIDKAAEKSGKYKVTNERLLKLNANLSDRVD